MQNLRKFKASDLLGTNPCINPAQPMGGEEAEHDLISIMDAPLEFYQKFWPVMQSGFSSAKARQEICYLLGKYNVSKMVIEGQLEKLESDYVAAKAGSAEAFTHLKNIAFGGIPPGISEVEKQLLIDAVKTIIRSLASTDELYDN